MLPGDRETTLSMTCRNQVSEIARAAQAVEHFGAANGLPADVVFKVNLALDEVVTNVISHGYQDQNDHQIDITLTLDGGEVVVRVEDDGRAYNPLDAPRPDLEADIDARPIGGLGVHIVRTLMDGLEYRREGGRNVLIMRKRTSGGTASRDEARRPD